jgi:hypothetical protein
MAAIGSFLSTTKSLLSHRHTSEKIKEVTHHINASIACIKRLSLEDHPSHAQQKQLAAELDHLLALKKELRHLKEKRWDQRLSIALSVINTASSIISLFFPLAGLIGYGFTMGVGAAGFLGNLASAGCKRLYQNIRYRLHPEAKEKDRLRAQKNEIEKTLGTSLTQKVGAFLRKTTEKAKTIILAGALATSMTMGTLPEEISVAPSKGRTETSRSESPDHAPVPRIESAILDDDAEDKRSEKSSEEPSPDDSPEPAEEVMIETPAVIETRKKAIVSSASASSIDVAQTGRPLDPLQIRHTRPVTFRAATLFEKNISHHERKSESNPETEASFT